MRVGEVSVYPLLDGVMPMPLALLYPDLEASTWRSLGAAIEEDGSLRVPFGGFLAADDQGHRVVFDLGGGPARQLLEVLPNAELPEMRELLPGRLEKAGVPTGAVTDVVFSHLHLDHVGWAVTDGRPTFPHARHHIHALDWQHFVVGSADESVRDRVEPLAEAVHLWEGQESSPYEWLRIIHAPGHTPGTSIALIQSAGHRLALIGDLFHHPVAVQHPHWRCGFDWDDAAAASTRHKWIDTLRQTGTPLAGPHFPGLIPVTIP
jgi:glyoxylase-like metal-dependent hydrolase (beta-lactamase superfamily II)